MQDFQFLSDWGNFSKEWVLERNGVWFGNDFQFEWIWSVNLKFDLSLY